MGDNEKSDLRWAVQNGDLDLLKSIIEPNSKLANENIGDSGRPPLCIAADYNQCEVIEYLIIKGADINKKDKYEISPLLAAIYEGHTKSVKYLLSKGADKTCKAPDGSCFIDCAENQEIKNLLK